MARFSVANNNIKLHITVLTKIKAVFSFLLFPKRFLLNVNTSAESLKILHIFLFQIQKTISMFLSFWNWNQVQCLIYVSSLSRSRMGPGGDANGSRRIKVYKLLNKTTYSGSDQQFLPQTINMEIFICRLMNTFFTNHRHISTSTSFTVLRRGEIGVKRRFIVLFYKFIFLHRYP